MDPLLRMEVLLLRTVEDLPTVTRLPRSSRLCLILTRILLRITSLILLDPLHAVQEVHDRGHPLLRTRPLRHRTRAHTAVDPRLIMPLPRLQALRLDPCPTATEEDEEVLIGFTRARLLALPVLPTKTTKVLPRLRGLDDCRFIANN